MQCITGEVMFKAGFVILELNLPCRGLNTDYLSPFSFKPSTYELKGATIFKRVHLRLMEKC